MPQSGRSQLLMATLPPPKQSPSLSTSAPAVPQIASLWSLVAQLQTTAPPTVLTALTGELCRLSQAQACLVLSDPEAPGCYLAQGEAGVSAEITVAPLPPFPLPTTPWSGPWASLSHDWGQGFCQWLETLLSPASAPISPQTTLELLPLMAGAAPIGLLVLVQPQALESLGSVTAPVAIALTQHQAQQQQQRQHRQQQLIQQLSQINRTAPDLSAALAQTLTSLVSALPQTQGYLLLLKYAFPLPPTADPGAHTQTIQATLDCAAPAALADDLSFSLATCTLCQQALALAPEGLLARADHLMRLSLGTTPQLSPLGITLNPTAQLAPIFDPEQWPNCLLMPLEREGTVLGFIVLQQPQGQTWSLGDLALVNLVATQLSTAILQSKTLQQVNSLVEERTAQLRRSVEVQGKLYEQTRRHLDQLRQLNQLKDEFVSTMSHELRTPLTSMTLAIRMLRQANLPPARQTTYLDILEKQCLQETNLINDLLALQKLESGETPLTFSRVNLGQFVQAQAEALKPSLVEAGLDLKLVLPHRPLWIETEVDSLSRILGELLTNACKYARAGTVVTLALQAPPDASAPVQLSLSNQGCGISAADLPHIFDKFRRGSGVTQQAIPGTGLGLALVKCLVQHLQGDITAQSQSLGRDHNWQTTFTLALPPVSQS